MPSGPVSTDAARPCEVLPLKLVASAVPTSVTQAHRLAASMRWIIGTACLISLTIGVALILEAPDVTRPPAGGIAILFIGVAVTWMFTGVGAFAWIRRPENRTGALMTLVGVLVAITGLQFFDTPAL